MVVTHWMMGKQASLHVGFSTMESETIPDNGQIALLILFLNYINIVKTFIIYL